MSDVFLQSKVNDANSEILAVVIRQPALASSPAGKILRQIAKRSGSHIMLAGAWVLQAPASVRRLCSKGDSHERT
jgi:hypothetical protein